MHAKKVKKFRAKFNLNQTDFGVLFGLTSKAVSNIETGFRKPSRTMIQILGLFASLPEAQVQEFFVKLRRQGNQRSSGFHDGL